MSSASAISVTDVYTSSSSIRCHRHARASAFTQRAVGLWPRRGRKLAAVGRDDALAATTSLETSLDEDLDDSCLLDSEQLIPQRLEPLPRRPHAIRQGVV